MTTTNTEKTRKEKEKKPLAEIMRNAIKNGTAPKATIAPYTRAELRRLDELATAKRDGRDRVPTDANGIIERRAEHIETLNAVKSGRVRKADGTRKYLTARQRDALKKNADAVRTMARINADRAKITDAIKNADADACAELLKMVQTERIKDAMQRMDALRHIERQNKSVWRVSMDTDISMVDKDADAVTLALYGVSATHCVHNALFHIHKLTENASNSKVLYFFGIANGSLRCLANLDAVAVRGKIWESGASDDAGDDYDYNNDSNAISGRLESLYEIARKGAFDLIQNNVAILWTACVDYCAEHNADACTIADIFDDVRGKLNRNFTALRDYLARVIPFNEDKHDRAYIPTFSIDNNGNKKQTDYGAITAMIKKCVACGMFDSDGIFMTRKKNDGARYSRTNVVKMLFALERVLHLNNADSRAKEYGLKDICEIVTKKSRYGAKWQYVADAVGKDADGNIITPRSAEYLLERFTAFIVDNEIIDAPKMAQIEEAQQRGKKRAVIVTDMATNQTTLCDSFTTTAKYVGCSRSKISALFGGSVKAIRAEINGKTYALTLQG